MNIYALDSKFQLVATGIPYINLQWNRKYYEAGDFTLQIPKSLYDTSWAYIGTNDRPELGMVQKVKISGEDEVLISGFFCEKMLDDKTCYPRYIGDTQKTETAVRNIFTTYKDDLPIVLAAANNPLLGDRTQSDFSDDQLGEKLYSILESRELSLRVVYDYVANQLRLGVWSGLDRTQSQDKNSYYTFSTEFGNIGSKEVDIDESDYKNYAIIPCNANDNDVEQNVYYVDLSKGGYKYETVFDMRSTKPEDGQTMADFKASIEQEGLEKLLSYQIVQDVNIDTVSDEGYMEDYNLGDKVDVILSDVGVSLETRIIEVNEVFKAQDGHTITVGLGNKRISNMRRLVNSTR